MKIKKLNELNEFNTIFSQEFYDLMQEYRHTSFRDQKMTIETFQNILNFIEQNYILKDENIIKQWLLEQEANKYNI